MKRGSTLHTYNPLQPPEVWCLSSFSSNLAYREYKPIGALETYVACYWTIMYRPTGEGYVHRIVPDGCVDIIFDLELTNPSASAFVTGLMTSYTTIRFASNQSLLGIRFYLEHAHELFGCPVSELDGLHVSLEDLWGRTIAHDLVEQVKMSHGLPEMIERIESTLMRRRHIYHSNSHQLLQLSMYYLYNRRGDLTIRQLADQLCYSERNVRRIFLREFGMSPKELSGIIRFQYMFRELLRSSSPPSAEVAVKYGYYDQSHFIRNFKRYYGLAPSQVLG